jgi:hypothetical protein
MSHARRRDGQRTQGRRRGHGRIVAAGAEVPAMIGKFVTDAVLAAIIVAALLAVAAILR